MHLLTLLLQIVLFSQESVQSCEHTDGRGSCQLVLRGRRGWVEGRDRINQARHIYTYAVSVNYVRVLLSLYTRSYCGFVCVMASWHLTHTWCHVEYKHLNHAFTVSYTSTPHHTHLHTMHPSSEDCVFDIDHVTMHNYIVLQVLVCVCTVVGPPLTLHTFLLTHHTPRGGATRD